MRVLRVVGKSSLRFGALLLSLGMFMLAGRVLLGGTEVRAAMDTYYPEFCLGGWEHPRRASGEPDTDSGSLTHDGSAYLAPDVSAQIFCGYFPVEARTNAPVSADVRLVWDMPGADSAPTQSAQHPDNPVLQEAPPADANTEPDTPQPPADSSQIPEEPTSTAAPAPDDTSSSSPAEKPEASPSANPPQPPASTDTPAESPSTDTVPDASADTPTADPEPMAPAPVPTPSAEPAPTPEPPRSETPTSFIEKTTRVASDWIRVHTAIAHAQEDGTSGVPFSISDWFDVSYSLDGVRWHSIGRVNASNWRDFTVTVPLSSWDDLQNVQIMVAALPSLSEKPPVYLDAMELRVETDPTLSETASAAIGAANDMVGTAVDAVLSIFSGKKAAETPQATAEPQPAPAPVTIPVERAKKRALQFSVHGDALPVPGKLPWQEESASSSDALHTTAPTIAVAQDGRSFTVSGTCSDKYAVIITYRNPDDYRDNPRNSIANVATPCENGQYTFNLGALPDSTQGGAYYLLVGQEGDTGTWTPISALLPISIAEVEVDQ